MRFENQNPSPFLRIVLFAEIIALIESSAAGLLVNRLLIKSGYAGNFTKTGWHFEYTVLV